MIKPITSRERRLMKIAFDAAKQTRRKPYSLNEKIPMYDELDEFLDENKYKVK